MDKLWIVTTYENHEYKQVPIVLGDDWLVSEAYIMDGYVHLKNASDGTEIKVRLSDLVDNPMGKMMKPITYTKLSNTLINGISDELMPVDDAFYGSSSEIANIYLALGHTDKAAKILFQTTNNYYQLMRWYLSMNDRNLRRINAQFTDIASYQYSLVFPLLEKCIDKDQYEELFVEFHNMCDEFERRLN